MELRSGARVQSGYATAEEARAACMGSARVQLAPGQHGAFDAAVRGVLLRWTALRLAVENAWAGDESDARAAELEQSILAWFYAKGEHYAYELEEHLDDFLVEVFHVEAEDGSPAEVAALLVHVFEACAAGDFALAAQLAAADTAHGALAACQRDMSDKRWTLDGGAPGGAGEQRLAAEDVSPDALADALGGMGSLGSGPPPEPELEPLEDGWERAPVRKGRRAQQRAPMAQ